MTRDGIVHSPAQTNRERGPVTNMPLFQTTCSCGWYSNWYVTEDKAKVAFFAHRHHPSVPPTPGVSVGKPAV